MRNPFIIFLLFVVALLQVSILQYFKIFGAKPDLLLIAVFWFTLSCPSKQAVILSACAGLLEDIFAPYSFGIYSLLFALFSLSIIRLGKEISIDNNLVRFIVFYIISFCNTAVIRFLFFLLGNNVPLNIFLRVAFLGSLYNALIALLLFKKLRVPEKVV